MQDIILDNTYLILLIPFWIFLIIMIGRFFAVYVNKTVIYVLTLLASFAGILFSLFALLNLESPLLQSFQFIKINNFIIYAGLHIDKLSLIFGLVLFVVSFLVQIFSISYMKDEKKSYRFYALMNLFNFAMSGLIFSPNLFQMYIFWGLVGLVSYLLIGFDYQNPIKSEASRRVFLTNSIGDVALFGGIVLFSYFIYSYAANNSFTTLAFEDINATSTLLYAYTSTVQFYIICGLFIVAAFVKSAQFPFYNWLQEAMEAKLPVSALLHSATMVAAGVYLTLRLLPMYMLESGILTIVWSIGILTALICSLMASIETHPKKVLAYSTSANLGLMFFALGGLNTKAAIIFFISHAFIKSMLFLSLPDEKRNYNLVSLISFMVGSLILSGLIFSGMVSKELIFSGIHNSTLSVIFCLVSFFTAFYLMRLSLVMIKEKELDKTGKVDLIRIIPCICLILADILLYVYLKLNTSYEIKEPFFVALVAWGVVYVLYKKNLLEKYTKTSHILADFSNNIIPKYYLSVANLAENSEEFLSKIPLKKFALIFVKSVNWVEINMMNKSVSFTADLFKKISETDMRLQLGNVQAYNAYALWIITITVSFIIIVYTLVLNQMS